MNTDIETIMKPFQMTFRCLDAEKHVGMCFYYTPSNPVNRLSADC